MTLIRLSLVLAAALAAPALSPASVAAEPIRFKSQTTCTTAAGNTITLKPGVYLEEDLWQKMDNELKRLQDEETRLEAENEVLLKELRKPKSELTILAAIVIGAVGGMTLL